MADLMAHDARGRLQARIAAIERHLTSLFAQLAILDKALHDARGAGQPAQELQKRRAELAAQLEALEAEQASQRRQLARIPPEAR